MLVLYVGISIVEASTLPAITWPSESRVMAEVTIAIIIKSILNGSNTHAIIYILKEEDRDKMQGIIRKGRIDQSFLCGVYNIGTS